MTQIYRDRDDTFGLRRAEQNRVGSGRPHADPVSRVKISDENTFIMLEEMKKLTLRNIGIVKIPKVGAKLEVLDLFDNKISKLKENSLDGSYNLQDLNLRRNQIFQIDNDFFSHNDAVSLTTVDLSDNNLLSLDPENFRNIVTKQNIRIIAYRNKFELSFSKKLLLCNIWRLILIVVKV